MQNDGTTYRYFKLSEFVPATERVPKGVAWLDENHLGWWEIVGESLNLKSNTDCILCRLSGFPNWTRAKSVLGLTHRQAVMMGFEKMICVNDGARGTELKDDSYEELEALWLDVILTRCKQKT